MQTRNVLLVYIVKCLNLADRNYLFQKVHLEALFTSFHYTHTQSPSTRLQWEITMHITGIVQVFKEDHIHFCA